MRWSLSLLVVSVFFLGFTARADRLSVEQYRSVAIRKVGHGLLLKLGDSTSRVLPVVRNGNRYILEFDRTFGFQPELLSTTIDSILKEVQIHSPYMVEVLNCNNAAVEYSFLARGYQLEDSTEIMPCGKREYSENCYKIAITFEGAPLDAQAKSESKETSAYWLWLFIPTTLLLLLAFVYLAKKSSTKVKEHQTHIIPIGAYQFDKRSMHLNFQGETVELTSKEADLLFLLHSSRNETVERDTILRIVWGDDGDYVGRTLDVFISKLRKKLSEDPTIKIANIRGVGYRLVVDSAVA